MSPFFYFRLGEVDKLAYEKIFNISTSRLIAHTSVEKLAGLGMPLLLSIIVSQLVVKSCLTRESLLSHCSSALLVWRRLMLFCVGSVGVL